MFFFIRKIIKDEPYDAVKTALFVLTPEHSVSNFYNG